MLPPLSQRILACELRQLGDSSVEPAGQDLCSGPEPRAGLQLRDRATQTLLSPPTEVVSFLFQRYGQGLGLSLEKTSPPQTVSLHRLYWPLSPRASLSLLGSSRPFHLPLSSGVSQLPSRAPKLTPQTESSKL